MFEQFVTDTTFNLMFLFDRILLYQVFAVIVDTILRKPVPM